MPASLHNLVQTGFADAMTYDAHRPSYPLKSVNLMLDKLEILDAPGARILEIGAGTGKLTEQLVGQEKNYDILAVEPHAPMRAVLERKSLPGVKAVDAPAANLSGVEDAWADALVVAQVSLNASIKYHRINCSSRIGFSLVCNTPFRALRQDHMPNPIGSPTSKRFRKSIASSSRMGSLR